MRSVVFFNNKGGVGKTTLACNIGAELARSGLRILLVDCDPQCNTTQLLIGEERSLSLYGSKDESEAKTVMHVVERIREGDSSINKDISLIDAAQNRFRVDLLPGHPRLSLIEDKLSVAWNEVKAREIAGLRKTNWFYFLSQSLSDKYDLAIIDVGPSLGSLNRSILLGADNFVTPMGSDIFSIIGIRNISDWLADWLNVYTQSANECAARESRNFSRFGLPLAPKITQGFLGYTVQQYITKSKEGYRIPTKAYEKILRRVTGEVNDHLRRFAPPEFKSFKLGDVPNMYSLVPLAQSVSAPITRLRSGDGLVGSQYSQVESYRAIVTRLARSIARRLELPIA